MPDGWRLASVSAVRCFGRRADNVAAPSMAESRGRRPDDYVGRAATVHSVSLRWKWQQGGGTVAPAR